jgi:hypothetical protein
MLVGGKTPIFFQIFGVSRFREVVLVGASPGLGRGLFRR